MNTDLEVLDTGPLATVQDSGRSGYCDIGVGLSGPADRGSFGVANRLVGNESGTAAIEVVFGGLAVRARRPLTVALAGAECPARIDGRDVATHSTLRLRTGSQLHLGTPPTGVRSYLAVRGGIDVAPVLGSRATDVLAGLGPEPLRPGTQLAVGNNNGALPQIDFAPVAPIPARTITLRVVAGPRDDWFTTAAHDRLCSEPYSVTTQSDRIGMRLAGPELTRSRADELPSEGMVTGAIQVPPSGQPTLLLADHPVTGGYPVIAVVVSTDVDHAAQARPGQTIRFVRASCPGSRTHAR